MMLLTSWRKGRAIITAAATMVLIFTNTIQPLTPGLTIVAMELIFNFTQVQLISMCLVPPTREGKSFRGHDERESEIDDDKAANGRGDRDPGPVLERGDDLLSVGQPVPHRPLFHLGREREEVLKIFQQP